jgi:excisionase family DNA binding protein
VLREAANLAGASLFDYAYLIIYHRSVQTGGYKEGRLLEQENRLSLREAADALGISEVTARRWVKSGKLKAYQPGRKYLIPRGAVDELLESDSGKPHAPRSPREWLRAQEGVLLLSLTEEELADHFAALYPGESVKFADRINKEWQAVEMACDLAEDPNAPLVHDAYAHAQSRYLQARTLAPISTSYDPDNPEKPEQVTLRPEKPETPARIGREGMDDTA